MNILECRIRDMIEEKKQNGELNAEARTAIGPPVLKIDSTIYLQAG